MRRALPLFVLISPLSALAMPQDEAGSGSAAPTAVVASPSSTPQAPPTPVPIPVASAVAQAPAPPAPAPASPAAPVAAVAPIPSTPAGVAVVALGNSSEVTWPLARAVYARPKLRPAHLSEDQVRVLAGDPVDKAAPMALQELSNDRANLGGDPSTTSLVSLGSQLHVAALYVVVAIPSKVAGVKDRARARLFSVSNRAFVGDWRTPQTGLEGNIRKDADFDAAGWSGAVKSAEAALTEKSDGGKPFYSSPWFWGALGAAAALGTTAIIISSTKSTDTLSLRGEVTR